MSQASSPSQPIAIIGMECLFPGADGLQSYWSNILNGADSISEVPESHWSVGDYFRQDPSVPDHTYAKRGGFLSPVDFPSLEFGIAPNSLEATDTTQLLGLLVARRALQDAGYDAGRDFDRDRVSVVLGVTGTLPLVIPLGARLGHPIWRRALKNANVPDDVAEKVIEEIADGYVGWQEDSFPGLLGNVVAGRIANRLDLGGTNCVVDAACASSLSALHLAMMELQTGRCDMALSGGMDTFNDIFMYMCFSKTPALSPTGDAKPFSADGDGTILGEGVGCVILKRLADAQRDGDKIYAVIRGMGTSSDGKGKAIYAPSPGGQTKALRRAYESAGVTADTIELIEAHGTGTKAGDTAEATALAEVYRSARADGTWCAIGSVKSQVGHTKAAAGAAGLIKAALALHHKAIPPTIKVSEPIDALAPGRSPIYVNRTKRPWLADEQHPRRAAVSSFGFGGSNYHCVLEEYERQKQQIDWDGDVQIAAFSGSSPEELQKKASDWFALKTWEEKRHKAAASRSAFNAGESYRLVIAANRQQRFDKLRDQLNKAFSQNNGQSFWSLPDGAYYSHGGKPGNLAMLFPGQGAQYVGMGRDLACQFPQLLDALNLGSSRLRVSAPSISLGELIYPFCEFTEAERLQHETSLRSTNVAQPAIGAVSLGLLKILKHFGVIADAAAGHSFGELTALCAAGRISDAEYMRLAVERGRLMADCSGGQGGMLALQLSADQTEDLLRNEKLNLVVANKNAPAQTVISGGSDEIERAASVFEQAKISCRRLQVGAAFHSSLVAEATTPFLTTLQVTDFSPSGIPVFANTTGQPYPDCANECRELLAAQLANPVQFIDAVANLHDNGVRTFVEVGPGSILTGLVRSILHGKDNFAVAMDASRGNQPGHFDLARTLGLLAALGHSVDLNKWDDVINRQSPKQESKPALTVSICGVNYRKPKQTQPRAKPKTESLPVTTMKSASSNEQTAQPSVPQPAPAPVASATHSVSPTTTLRKSVTRNQPLTEQSISAIQSISEQTADLHRQFLDGQDRALQVLQTLLQQNGSTSANGVLPAAVAYQPREAIASPPVNHGSALKAQTNLAAAPAPARQIEVPEQAKSISAPVEPAAVTMQTQDAGEKKQILLEIIADKTGYPVEMLELGMEMDADLGIDSIKRVEIFSAVQEKLPNSPTIQGDRIGDLRTLQDVVDLLNQNVSAESPSASAPVSQQSSPAISTGGDATLTDQLLQIVADKTGYPPDMLELDMEMDADLGIDSIKRVEIFSSLQEKIPGLPPMKSEDVGALRTLREVVIHLSGPVLDTAPSPVNEIEVQPQSPAANLSPEVIEESTSLLRFVPSAIPLTDAREKLVFTPGAEVLVISNASHLAEIIAGRLDVLGHPVRILSPADALEAKMPSDLGGAIFLSASDGMSDGDLWDCFKVLKKVGPLLRREGSGDRMLMTVSRLDGRFGLHSGSVLADPISGGLAGLAKTASWEWPEVYCKAVDVASDMDAEELGHSIVEEFLHRGPLEVGLTPDGPIGLDLTEGQQTAPNALPLQHGDVVLVSGGARGVTAEAALALAEHCSPVLVILGRSSLPGQEPEWLQSLQEEKEIKQALSEKGLASPREINEQCRQIKRNREIRQNLSRLEHTGAKVDYRPIDVRDSAAVESLCEDVRDRYGPVKGLVHGAGVIADRRIEDKTEEQFRAVYDTKVIGLRNLIASLENDPLKVIGLFSSSSGRFGRAGQADYAIANEVLNKLAQEEMRKRPNCCIVSFNWGPWEGGMVNPALKKMFADEGLGLIPLESGARFFAQEFSQQCADVEVVVLGEGSKLPTANVAPKHAVTESVNGTPKAANYASAFSQTINIGNTPILLSHVIGGRAVVPVVLMIEWFAHGALHANPGLVFHGFDDLRVFRGIKLDANDDYRIEVVVANAIKREDGYHIPVELRGGADGAEVRHASATMVLAQQLKHAPQPVPPVAASPYEGSVAEVYDSQLFHGPGLHGIARIGGISSDGITGSVKTAAPPRNWLSLPPRSKWSADPLALDAAFQLMVLWTRNEFNQPSLPIRLGSYRQHRGSFPVQSVEVRAIIKGKSGQVVNSDIDFVGEDGRVVGRVTEYECVMDASLQESYQRRELETAVLSTH